jgi:hypothetical protein
MFDQYSYKKKFLALGVIFIMLGLTAYKRSFKTLFEVISEYKSLSSKVATLNKKSQNRLVLDKEVAYLDKILGKEGISKEVVQQQIISFATQNSSKVSINDLRPIHVFKDQNNTIITNQLDVTGNVNQLINLGYDFEKKFEYSRMVSMNFYTTKKDNKTEVLHLKMIFQNYENSK